MINKKMKNYIIGLPSNTNLNLNLNKLKEIAIGHFYKNEMQQLKWLIVIRLLQAPILFDQLL